MIDDASGPWEALDRAFLEALTQVLEAVGPRVVLFSGGVDSGLLAWELRRTHGVTLLTVGLAGSDDLAWSRDASSLVDLPWVGRALDDDVLAEVERLAAPDLDGVPGPRRGIFVALAAAFAVAPPGLLVCGQGADELFFGYAHYRGLSAEEAATRSEDDLALLTTEDWPRTLRLARRWGRSVVAPYLHPSFVLAASGIPPQERLSGEFTKPCLRRWARHRGVPAEIAERPKRAVQYGSGVDRWLRRRSRRAA